MTNLHPITIEKPDFTEVIHLIEAARKQAYQAVNTTLIELYWQVGAYISHKIQATVNRAMVLSPNWLNIWRLCSPT